MSGTQESLRVAVLAGGLSLEREVSLRSGRRVAEALTDRGHRVTRLDLDEGLVDRLVDADVDVCYLALHGKAGEDGTIQGLLDLLGLPYTGPDAIASAIAWDKGVCKGLLVRAGLTTPDWIALSSDAIQDMGAAQALDRVVERLGHELIVKPSQGGASMGVRRVGAEEALATALVSAFSYHDVVLVERFISGAEVAVSVVDRAALPAVEVVPRAGAYDFAARYTHGATEFYAPARLDDATLERCRQAAVDAYELVGCRDVSRADLIVDDAGQPWLLELDTCPGMTETSLLPMAAHAAGWDFPSLCERIILLAAARGAGRAPRTAPVVSPSGP
ncbi:MAG TPA: D-alanine--D-alanine ligase [Egibacteraceae bacterium]|nr:D-alanine--D-alanine ligase [Egibacteraceae bacterium]